MSINSNSLFSNCVSQTKRWMSLAVQLPSKIWKTVQVIFEDMYDFNDIEIYSQCHPMKVMSQKDLAYFRVQVMSIYLWARINIPLSNTSSKQTLPNLSLIHI